MMPHTFAFLKDCKARDLVRVKVNDDSAMALVGAAEGRGFQALVVMPEKKAPFIINLLQSGMIDGDFDAYQVLNYGNEYQLRCDHSEGCQVAEGPLFETPGSVVLTEAGEFLVVRASTKEARYFDIKNGTIHGKRGGGRAAFKFWGIWLNDENYGKGAIVNHFGEQQD